MPRGFDPDRNTFTQYYGSEGLDAALLLIPRGGIPAMDRLQGDRHRRSGPADPTVDGFLLRYRAEHDDNVDGLPGGEGAFLAWTFRLVDALHNIGRVGEAEQIFRRLLDLRNDVGLLSEEYDPIAGRRLGDPLGTAHSSLTR
ncbi:hypothetical protein ACIBPB_11750 [Micromonospora sp. NPDC049836]|uniref:hypothetical protein n=1 Tax=Micromonospora sp. NPDC049836 TaxID=3364274 RepID=UPI0037B4A451